MPTNQVNQKILLADLLLKYADEISSTHKGVVSETYRLKSVARRWIGKLDIRYLNEHQFIQYHDDRFWNILVGHLYLKTADILASGCSAALSAALSAVLNK